VDGSPREEAALAPDLVDLFAAFQHAIVSALLDRVERVHAAEGIERLALSGGVAANTQLRRTLSDWGARAGVEVLLPERAFTTDNGAMIAWAGLRRHLARGTEDFLSVNARSRWPLGASP
jgi:N6-L-threonylcarbamoyladenine synthase